MQDTASRSGATQPHGRQGRGPNTPVEWTRSSAPRRRWRQSWTAPQCAGEARRFRVTHPYHPWCGHEFELIDHKQTWGEDRVFFHDEELRLIALPATWTDVVPADPFVLVANGRSPFRAEDLWELAQFLRRGWS